MVLDPVVVDRLAALAYARHHPVTAPGWADLPELEKEANRDGVRAIPELMAELGYRITADPGDAVAVTGLSDEEVERTAVLEHDRWARFTQRLGYRYGPERDDDVALTHPDLVPWEELDEPTRDKDRIRVRAIPDLLATADLHLVPS